MECPVCTAQVATADIEDHVNACLDAARSSDGDGDEPLRDDANDSSGSGSGTGAHRRGGGGVLGYYQTPSTYTSESSSDSDEDQRRQLHSSHPSGDRSRSPSPSLWGASARAELTSYLPRCKCQLEQVLSALSPTLRPLYEVTDSEDSDHYSYINQYADVVGDEIMTVVRDSRGGGGPGATVELPLAFTQHYVWLDIINIDQNARDLSNELACLPEIYGGGKLHIVHSLQSSNRGWCCFELAMRSLRGDTPGDRSIFHIEEKALVRWMRSRGVLDAMDTYDAIAGLQSRRNIREAGLCNFRFENAGFTVEGDRATVRDAILKHWTIEQLSFPTTDPTMEPERQKLHGFFNLFVRRIAKGTGWTGTKACQGATGIPRAVLIHIYLMMTRSDPELRAVPNMDTKEEHAFSAILHDTLKVLRLPVEHKVRYHISLLPELTIVVPDPSDPSSVTKLMIARYPPILPTYITILGDLGV